MWNWAVHQTQIKNSSIVIFFGDDDLLSQPTRTCIVLSIKKSTIYLCVSNRLSDQFGDWINEMKNIKFYLMKRNAQKKPMNWQKRLASYYRYLLKPSNDEKIQVNKTNELTLLIAFCILYCRLNINPMRSAANDLFENGFLLNKHSFVSWFVWICVFQSHEMSNIQFRCDKIIKTTVNYVDATDRTEMTIKQTKRIKCLPKNKKDIKWKIICGKNA